MASRSLGTLTLDLIARVGGFTSGMTQAERAADKSLTAIEKRAYKFGQALGTGLKYAAGAAAAGVAALAASLQLTINGLDDLSKSAQKVGITTEELSKLAYAGELADVSMESLTGALGKLTKAQAEALDTGSETAKVFAALGISVKDAAGNLRNSSDVLADFADVFQKLGGGPEAIAAGFKIFGRSFQDLIPLLKDGREGITGAADELERMGGVIRTDTGEAAEQFNDNLTRLKVQFQSVFAQVAQNVLPTLVKLSQDLIDAATSGTLAHDSVKLLTGLVSGGISILDGFKNSVEGITIAFGFMEKASDGAFESAKNVLTLGAAEGGFWSGLGKVKDAAQEAANEAQRIANMKPPKVSIPGVDEIDFGLGAPLTDKERLAQQAAALKALQAALGGSTNAKKANAKATKEMTEEEKLFRDQILEVNDLIDEMAQGTQSDLVNQRLDNQNRREEEFAQTLADLQFQKDLLGQTADEQERLNLLRYAGIDAASEEGKILEESLKDLQARREIIDEQVAAMDGLRDSFRGFLGDLKEGKNAWDALKDAAANFADILFDLAAQKIIEQLFGQQGSTSGGSAGGWFGQLAGLFFGGGRALGGPVNAGTMYRVNENQPELLTVGNRDYLMMGAQGGKVTPRPRLGGGATVNNTFLLAAPTSQRTQEQIAQKTGFEVQQATRRNG